MPPTTHIMPWWLQVDDVVLAMDEALRPAASGLALQLRRQGRVVDLVMEQRKMKWAFKVRQGWAEMGWAGQGRAGWCGRWAWVR